MNASLLVGRAAEMKQLHAHLAADRRLVTIVGTIGVGKTSLARAFVRGTGRAPGGMSVCHCSLAAAGSLEDLHARVAKALAMPTHAFDPKLEACDQIGAWLSQQGPLILVLDNLDRMVGVAATSIARWRRAAPEVFILATSHSALRLPDEQVIQLDPLPVTPSADGHGGPSEAATLFLDRAGSLLGRVPTSPEDLELIEQIVAQLDGLPLAIDLAAGRLDVLSLSEIRSRLADRFHLLRDPSREDRHATLSMAIEASWELLSPDEQRVAREASVFPGGFSLAAAEAVIAPSSEPGGPLVLDAIHGLCRRSFLRVSQESRSASEFRLHAQGSLREFAATRLAESGERAAVFARFAEYFLSRGEVWRQRVEGTDAVAAMNRLAVEQDNLLGLLHQSVSEASAALDPVTRAAAADRALRAALIVSPLLAARSAPTTHVDHLDAALRAAADTTAATSVPAAYVHHARALSLRVTGNTEGAARDLERALALAEQHGEHALVCRVQSDLGGLFEEVGEYARSTRHFDEALTVARREGDRGGEALALLGVALQHVVRAEVAKAAPLLERALQLLQGMGQLQLEERVLAHLSLTLFEEGRFEEATAHCRQALEICRRLGLRRREAIVMGYLGSDDHQRGRLAEAAQTYREALAIFREIGERRFGGGMRTSLAMIAIERGDYAEAETELETAMGVLRDPRFTGLALGTLAIARARQGRIDDAVARVAESEEALRRAGNEGPIPLLEIVRALIEVERGRRALETHTRAVAESHVQRARATLASHPDPRSGNERMVLRIVRRALAEFDVALQSWVVARTGAWFEGPDGERITVAHRATLRAMLSALAQQRIDRPGEVLSLHALASAAWPDTRLVPASEANRVRVAINALRTLGLRPILESAPPGYRLDPTVPMRWDVAG